MLLVPHWLELVTWLYLRARRLAMWMKLWLSKNQGTALMHLTNVRSVTQSCLILCDPMNHSLPGFSVHGISQARNWSGLPFPILQHLPNLGIEHSSPQFSSVAQSCLTLCNPVKCTRSITSSLGSPELAGGFFTTSPTIKCIISKSSSRCRMWYLRSLLLSLLVSSVWSSQARKYGHENWKSDIVFSFIVTIFFGKC